MSRPNQRLMVRAVRGLGRVRHRREVEWLALYLGAAWITYESVALTVDTFDLPSLVVRVTAVLLALGAISAVPFAHWFELTARELERTGGEGLQDVPGVPDVLEPAFARVSRGIRPRTAVIAGAGSTVLFSGFFLLLWSAWASGHDIAATDPRISVVVFPFRATGPESGAYGEGLADLLITTLDGTPGVRVVDPASVWRELRPKRGEPARDPELGEALRLSRAAGVRRFVTGTVVPLGSTLDVSARVYDASSGEVLGSIKASAHEDSVAGAIDRLAIDLVAEIWEREQLPTVPEIERYATSSADALKAYLEAKSLARRGLYEQAEPVIERAVALDSTFALAYLEQFRIRSWLLYMNADPFIGLREIIDRAMRYRERLTPRNRLRIEASRALDDTDGAKAAFLLERILSIDSLDVDALHSIAFTYLRDGWQLRKRTDEIVAAWDRVLQVDPTSIIARATRARLALLSGDPDDLRRELERLRAIDTTSAYVKGTLGAMQALLASEPDADSVLRALAAQANPVVITVARELRAHRPALAQRFFDELMADSMSVTHQGIGSGVRAQLWFAEGRLSGVDSLLSAGEFQAPMLINRHFLAAQLAGVGDSSISARAIRDLTAYLPADSLDDYFYDKPAWLNGWAVGAYQAMFGDTAEARIWQRAIESLPGDGTPLDYRLALTSDIEARLSARRGDLAAAEEQVRRALENWQIHSNNVFYDWAELGMRFQIAEVLRAQGAENQAEWFYRSFIPPHGWVGFYTARASFELGRIEEARGNRAAALDNYLRALRLWERGEPEVVGGWLTRTREGLRRLGGEASAPD